MGKFRFLEFDDHDEEAGNENAFAELLEQQTASETMSGPMSMRPGDPISGAVLQVGREAIYIDLGAKQTGVIDRSEFTSDGTLPEVGTTLNLFVQSYSGSEVVLTKKLKVESGGRQELEEAKASGAPIEAKVEKAVNAGYEVKFGSSRAFVPISHMTLPPAPGEPEVKPEDFVGKTMLFQVLEVREGGRSCILSRRALLKAEQEESRGETIRSLQEGETRQAVITKLMPFGAFARLGPGVEGLIPLGELAWKRVTKASEIVREGESVQVKIISIAHSPQLRIGLSLKDAGTDPWTLIAAQLRPGQDVSGKVSRLADFGAFVELKLGDSASSSIEGLVHISELSWTKRVKHPSEILRPGQSENFKVLSVDGESRRISLSYRGEMPDHVKEKAQKAAAQRSGEPTAEERELAEAWRSYESQTKSVEVARENASPLAAAFAKARSKNKANQ